MRFSNRLMAAALGRGPQTPTVPPSVEELYGDRDLTDLALRELALDIANERAANGANGSVVPAARTYAQWLLDPQAHRAARRSALARAHRSLQDYVKAETVIARAEEYEAFLGEREEFARA